MYKSLILLSVLLFSINTYSQTLIPDVNFEQFLVDEGIDTNGLTGDILNADAAAVTNLNITRVDITDFTGLEAFINVVSLNLGQNLAATYPLTTLTLLEELNFARNTALVSLDLSQNLELRELVFNNDAAPPLLTTLDLSNNTKLENLNVRTVRSITSLTLPATPTLTDIYVANLSVPTIDLSQLTGDLNFRIVGSDVFVTIIYPNKRDALKRLTLSSINFPTVDVSEMIGLQQLSLSSTDVETLILPSTTTLTSLSVLHHDFGASLDLSPVPALTSLDIRFARTVPLDIDLSNSPVLRDLWLTHNMMNTVDVMQNPELTSFRVYDNNLTSLDVTQNLELNRLEAYQNQLPSIDMSQNLELQYLDLSQNQIPVLDVTNNIDLRSLDIGENLFTATGLDLTQNTELTTLIADRNQIESLNITSNPEIILLDVSFNLFTGNDIIAQYRDIVIARGRLSGWLIVNDNQLSGPLPDLYGLYDPSVQTRRFRLKIENNEFEFEDFEDQHQGLVDLTTTQSIGPSPDVVIQVYTYAPQAKVNAIETPVRNAGESITLLTDVRGAQNHYTWFKDGVEIPDAADAPELLLNNLNTCDAGVYHCEITSDLVPFENGDPPGTNGKNLLLVRNDITLTVNATKSCVTLDMPLLDVPVNAGIQWNENPGACSYKITVRDIDNNVVLVNDEDVGEVTVYNYVNDFPANTNIGVTITPVYEDGDFSCTELSFRTNATTALPGCTSLLAPSNGSNNIAADLSSITWNPANGADEYMVAISSPSGANDIATTTTETFLLLTNDFNPGEIVTITIIPSNSVGSASGCSNPETFTIVTATPTPPNCTTLLSPADGDTDVAVNLNQISWNPAPNADGYRITINGSTSDANDVVDLVVNNTSHPFSNNFNNGEAVTVTIVPFNSDGNASGCSPETFTIVTATPTPPNCTTLLSPVDGDTDIAVNLNQISWNPAPNADGYRITINGSTSDANDVVDLVVNNTSHPFSNNFNNGETVTVTIVPFNSDGNASGCSTETFNIVASNPTPPNCTTLLSPVDGANNIAIDLNQISWNPAPNADGYRITINGSTSDVNDVVDLVANNTSHPFSNNFNNGETVTVTIVPFNGDGNASGCLTETFTTSNTSIALPNCTSLSAALINATTVSASSDLTWDASSDADGYLLRVGTISGGNDILDNLDVGNILTYDLPNDLPFDQQIFVTINPYNSSGTANCSEQSFTTSTEPVLPACTNLLSPLNIDIDVPINTIIRWNTATDANGYLLNIGTMPGLGDIINNQDVGNVTSFNLPNDLPENTEIFVSVLPYNSVGNAIFCEEESFITETLLTPPPCIAITAPENGSSDINVDTEIRWGSISDINGYFINIGTTINGNDILENLDVGLTTSYRPENNLPFDQEIFVSVLPYNESGTAENCEIHSFTTINESEVESLYGFSPDGDGINDYWLIEGIENYPNNTVVIYNRWGDMVFKIEGYDNSGNVFRGEANQLTGFGAGQLPEGTYFFQLLLPENNNLKQTKGYLVLKR